MNFVFWFFLAVISYTFVGYGLLLYVLVRLKRTLVKPFPLPKEITEYPTVSILIAAYNEEDLIQDKLINTLELDYPKEKLQIICITDGSTDETPTLVAEFPSVLLLHEQARSGKMAAIKRAMPHVRGEITVFTDSNTFVNKGAVKKLMVHYVNPKVGAVAGEKRIKVDEAADASSAGEGFYWKYESKLKALDYALYSNVGAAGELFSVRTGLYPQVEADTIIDDHMIAMRIAEKGYIIAYEPDAYALETASEDSKEELKRKIRIAAGGLQSILRLPIAANPFYYPCLTFQYISHRVLRWTIVPFLLLGVFVLNIFLVMRSGSSTLYVYFLIAQLLFYSLAIVGFYLERRNLRVKVMFVPYYFCLMNYAVIAGIFRYLKKQQSASWEKSKRKAALR